MDLDILGDLGAGKRLSGPRCDVAVLRETHPDLAEQYDRAFGRFSDHAIAEWITAHGGHLTRNTVLRHRRGECVRCRTS